MLSPNVKRSVPLAVWVLVVAVLLFIPLKIVQYGYLPMDDALRHAAKAVSGKSWDQILIMREGFHIDPSPGWQAILGGVHHSFGAGADALVVFSVVGLMLLVVFSALPWMRRPEAWLAALFIAAVFIPACTTRFARGRPFLLTDAVLVAILFLWSQRRNGGTHDGAAREDARPIDEKTHRWALILTPLLVAASAWIHGSWYLLCLPGAALLFAGFWRSALAYGVCWLAGSFFGCALTGHPFGFLFQSVRHMFGVFGDFVVNRQLEPELHPSDGELPAVLLAAVFLVWRKVSLGWNARLLRDPIFMMMVVGWVLGLKMRRFWWDFGTPAFIVWIALELQAHLEKNLSMDASKRLVVTLAIGAAAYLGFTSDRDSRWTGYLTAEFISPQNPDAVGWLPERGGIIYNADMESFFQTFFANPTADWKYVLGFEPAWMRPEDLKVLREAQWNFGDARAYQPWVEKMTHADRMLMRGNSQPQVPGIEWHYTGSGMWIGRLLPDNSNGTQK